jgi:thioredoxin-related protein
MKRLTWFASALLLIFLVVACDSRPMRATGYDPTSDPNAALERAVSQAKAGGKKVLVIAGGDWCPWCLALETFIGKNADVKAALDQTFVTIEVYFGEKNRNADFFAKLPRAKGYPHFWVISTDGKVINSLDTSGLEDGSSSYDKAKFLRFISETGKT